MHHTLLRRSLGTSPYLHVALEVSNEEFWCRRHSLGSDIRDARQPQLSEAILQMDAIHYRSIALCIRTPLPILRHKAWYPRRGLITSERGVAKAKANVMLQKLVYVHFRALPVA